MDPCQVLNPRQIGETLVPQWFALRYFVAYPNIRNYDGSWTEWGNLVRTPIEK